MAFFASDENKFYLRIFPVLLYLLCEIDRKFVYAQIYVK